LLEHDTPALSHLPQLSHALEQTAAAVRRSLLHEAWCALAARWLALVAALFLLDLLFALPVAVRWAGLIGQAGFLAWSLRDLLSMRARNRISAARAARLVEERHPELDNALIHAVQFSHETVESRGADFPVGERWPSQDGPEAKSLEQRQGTAGQKPGATDGPRPSTFDWLKQREIERGERAVAVVAVRDVVDRAAERRALWVLAGLAGVWVLAALCFPMALRAVVPRLMMPWRDELTPPFSLTRFEVRPPGATVRVGDSLSLAVRVSGPVPEDLALMTRTGGAEWQRLALESVEAGEYGVTLDALREDTWFYVQGGSSRSAKYRIRVLSPPVVRSLRVTYTYPAYTARAPLTEAVGDHGIHALTGTRAALEIRSNRPLRGGEMAVQLETKEPRSVALQVDPQDATRAVAELTLTRSGSYRIALTAADGQATPDAAHGPITAERDERPAVWIDHPGQDLLVTPEMKVPIHVQAEDDHGVQRVELHRIVNDLGDAPRSFLHASPARQVEDALVMDLPDLGVRPGDQLRYYATAYDNDPGAPKQGETQPYTLRVVSREKYLEALKQQRTPEDVTRPPRDMAEAVRQLAERQQQLAGRMEQLQKQLAAHPGDAAAQKNLEAARAEQKEVQEAARQVAQQMRDYAGTPAASRVEKAIQEQAGQMAEQLGQTAAGPMQQAQGRDPAQAARNAREAARRMAGVDRQMQQQVERTAQQLEKSMPLHNDMERFKELIERQGQLTLRAREFQQKEDAGTAARGKMEDLSAEQDRIQQETRRLQQDLRRHAGEARQDFPRTARSAEQLADEIDGRHIPEAMQSSRDRFRQWQGPEGFESAQRALREMAGMMQEAQNGQGQGQGELDRALNRSLGRSGLGQSLRELTPGQPGRGTAPGQENAGAGAAGGDPTRSEGARGRLARDARAYVPTVKPQPGTAGLRRRKTQNPIAGQPAGFAPGDVEVLPNPSRTPPKAADSDSGRYPAEYRKLISDYFKSVAEGQVKKR
jgi:hypothetical protein